MKTDLCKLIKTTSVTSYSLSSLLNLIFDPLIDSYLFILQFMEFDLDSFFDFVWESIKIKVHFEIFFFDADL